MLFPAPPESVVVPESRAWAEMKRRWIQQFYNGKVVAMVDTPEGVLTAHYIRVWEENIIVFEGEINGVANYQVEVDVADVVMRLRRPEQGEKCTGLVVHSPNITDMHPLLVRI